MRDCKHSQLVRSCHICELERERKLSDESMKRISLIIKEWDVYGKDCKYVLLDILRCHREARK